MLHCAAASSPFIFSCAQNISMDRMAKLRLKVVTKMTSSTQMTEMAEKELEEAIPMPLMPCDSLRKITRPRKAKLLRKTNEMQLHITRAGIRKKSKMMDIGRTSSDDVCQGERYEAARIVKITNHILRVTAALNVFL